MAPIVLQGLRKVYPGKQPVVAKILISINIL